MSRSAGAARQVAGAAAEQVEALVEQREHRIRRQELRARGGELDGERQAVEAPADLLDRGRVLVRQREARIGSPGALDEQRDRVLEVERVERVLLLARDPQRRTARDEERKPRRGLQHL